MPVYVGVCAYKWGYLQRPEDDDGAAETGVIGIREPPDTGAENWT